MTEPLQQGQLLEAAERKQRAAADPAVSAWVRANAGTGKTHVLVQRILRLLLSGADTRSILCLTFTKNAAAEMESRVLDKLGKWATSDERTLTADLTKLLGQPPADGERLAARCLFASVIDAPGGLAIMTIHGFCERVLRRYSFEANVPPGFAVLTEEEARDVLSEAMSDAFTSARAGPLREALNTVVAYAGDADFSRVLQAMLRRRNAIAHLLRVSDETDPFCTIEGKLRRLFDIGDDETREGLLARCASLLNDGALTQLVIVLSGGLKSDRDAAVRFRAVIEARNAEDKYRALKAAFTTQAGGPRSSLMTGSIKTQAPTLHEDIVEAQAAFVSLDEHICGLKVVEATLALLRLAVAIFERYEAGKRARAAVDFDDLISKTLSLFSRGDAADWVLYQLDGQIDHILIDEAQDTSPEQWEIVEKLTSDFYSGEGARDSLPTLFAVGDEKQSIYGFQGAVPELLGGYGAHYGGKAHEAGFRWRAVDLDLSFRTLAPVLNAVDSVTKAWPGLSHGSPVPHVAYRRDGAGLVELWEPERGEKEDKGTVWEPEAASDAAPKPAEALAARIAAQIKHWLESAEVLQSAERPIQPGDILILLRKREPMAGLLQAALKREGIPVSGADRMALLEELAVMDLLALASAMLQPDDDLALAEVLKSPLIGFSDDDLFELALGREASLWEALEGGAAGGSDGKYAVAARKIAVWRELALRLNPLDFFSHVLEAEGGRKAFAERLGAECFDALDELLNLAETFGARGPLSLSEFLVFIRRGASELKRETDQASQEVRIMTVHGAKGLEANIVILADACSNRSASGAPVYFIEGEAPLLPLWAVKGTSRLPVIAAANNSLKDTEDWEMGRLLYVAMTRARDRLYVTGFHNGEVPAGCWYDTISSALASTLHQAADFRGRIVWRHGSLAECPGFAWSNHKREPAKPPAWTDAPAPGGSSLPILQPSKLSSDQEAAYAREEAARYDRRVAKARGILIHRLLEVLPQLPAPDRASAARVITSAFVNAMPESQAQAAIESALKLLSSDIFALNEEASLREAQLAATIHDHSGKRCAILLGQADLISFGKSGIDIFDYKSGTASSAARPSSSFRAQLAAYKFVLRRIYPALDIRAALMDTRALALYSAQDTTLDVIVADLVSWRT